MLHGIYQHKHGVPRPGDALSILLQDIKRTPLEEPNIVQGISLMNCTCCCAFNERLFPDPRRCFAVCTPRVSKHTFLLREYCNFDGTGFKQYGSPIGDSTFWRRGSQQVWFSHRSVDILVSCFTKRMVILNEYWHLGVVHHNKHGNHIED